MRAITVNEDQNFERGQDVKSSIGIGKAAQVKKLLSDRFDGEHEYLTYKIHSLDNIEIRYQDWYFERRNLKAGEVFSKWKIKFIEIPQFIAIPDDRKGSTWVDEDKIYSYWAV